MEETQNKICPYCKAEISSDVQKCKYCGEWVMTEDADSLPKDLKHFNWGAFLLNWIWGIFHKKYITLLYFAACLIPIIGPLVISIWFGIAGNEWAWKSKNWSSIEEFNENQRNWVKLWLVLFTIGLIITIKMFIILTLISNIKL